MNREHFINTTTPEERSEKERLAREHSSEEIQTSIIGGVAVEAGRGCTVGCTGGCTTGGVQSMESFQPDLMEGQRCFVKFS